MAFCSFSPFITRVTAHFSVGGPVRTPDCDIYTAAISVSQTFSIYLHLLTLPKQLLLSLLTVDVYKKNLLLFVCLSFVFCMQPQSVSTTVVRVEESLRLDINSLIAFQVVQFELHVYNGVISYRSR